jgi:hypothetical protein
MDKKILQMEKDFPSIAFEKKDNPFFGEDEDQGKYHYIVSGFEGNSQLRINLRTEEKIIKLNSFLKKNVFIFPDFIAVKRETVIEVLLDYISFRSYRLLNLSEISDEVSRKILEVSLFYYKNELTLTVEAGGVSSLLTEFLDVMPSGKRYMRRSIILRIENYTKSSLEGVVNDTRNIINSVLFDIEYNYGIALETVNIESFVRRSASKRQKYSELPKDKINLVFKKYIPELIQYFHLAEKVDYLPFEFICYYHIIEYFSDKSAYHLVSKEVKRLLLKPDFHINTDAYVNHAINLFKKENDKYTGDKVKIERVLRQFIDREDLKEALNQIDLIGYFSKEETIDCVKPLKLPSINFEQDGNFFNDLTKRIYSVRCSIVHSNPDFDESKAVPFNPIPSNLEKLKIEIEIMAEIARKIIVNSKG